METNKIYHGDCLELMPQIASGSIDMILCDLPYGTTQCKWDTIIPFDKLWEQYERVIKPNGAIVLTASNPFTGALIMSNPKLFRYEWIWEKQKATRFLDAKKRPLQAHENIAVFYKKHPTYNPQKVQGKPFDKGYRRTNADKTQGEIYGLFKGARIVNESGMRYPRTVLKFNTAEGDGKFHPTQKPLALFEYFIRTYTNEGDIVLDNCIGGGTTPVACVNTKRKFIGMEKDEKYFNVACNRLLAVAQLNTKNNCT